MIPYFAQPSLPVGPITIHAFGLLVACGVLLGAKILQARAAAAAIPARAAMRLVNWILVGGFLGAHLFDRIVYFPAETLSDPVSIFRIWEGLSSFGGFIGLGLDEAIYTAFIVVLFHFLGRKPRFDGFYLGLFLLLYAPFRFGVDYLRIIDVRYGGLTPAQYGCIGLLLVGAAILAHRRAAYLVEHPRI